MNDGDQRLRAVGVPPARRAGGQTGGAPPRTSRNRAALTVVVALALAGAVIGALWAWLAPSIHGVVALTKAGERVRAHLGNEADHFFLAAFLVVGMLCVLAVVAAVFVWQWRAHRGPVMVAALAVGAAAAAGVAAGVGAVLVHWRYGTIDIERRAGITRASSPLRRRGAAGVLRALTTAGAVTILFPAAIAALVYCAHRGVDRTRRSGCVAARRDCRRYGSAGHSGERSTVRPVTTLATIFASPRHADVGHRVQQRRPLRPNHVLRQAAFRRTGRSASAVPSAPTSGAAAGAR